MAPISAETTETRPIEKAQPSSPAASETKVKRLRLVFVSLVFVVGVIGFDRKIVYVDWTIVRLNLHCNGNQFGITVWQHTKCVSVVKTRRSSTLIELLVLLNLRYLFGYFEFILQPITQRSCRRWFTILTERSF